MFVQPLLLWKSNKYYICWVCVCSLSYPACNVQAPYCHLWAVQLYHILPHYLTNGTIFKNKLLHIQYASVCSKTFVLDISHSKKNWARYDQKCTQVFMWRTCYSSQTSMKLSWQTFEKHSNIKLHENPSSRRQVVPCRRTDRQTWRR